MFGNTISHTRTECCGWIQDDHVSFKMGKMGTNFPSMPGWLLQRYASLLLLVLWINFPSKALESRRLTGWQQCESLFAPQGRQSDARLLMASVRVQWSTCYGLQPNQDDNYTRQDKTAGLIRKHPGKCDTLWVTNNWLTVSCCCAHVWL